MSMQSDHASVQLLDRSFTIRCPAEKKDQLKQAANQLNQRLNSMRQNGKAVEFEELLAIVALNVMYDLNALQQQVNADSKGLQLTLKQLHANVEAALQQADK
ncbi:MAG: cell division protein ZapA [Gammaproteobacteria bacterium]